MRDEDHLPVVMVSERIPSRVRHLIHGGPSPLPALRRAARALVLSGADTIAVPSATTHAYRSRLADEVAVPVLDLLARVGEALTGLGCARPVLLATVATRRLGLYEPHLPEPMKARYPTDQGQRQVDGIIDAVKRGEPLEALREHLSHLLCERPWPGDADCVVLGCTELSVVAPAMACLPLLDVTDVLARTVVTQWEPVAPRGGEELPCPS